MNIPLSGKTFPLATIVSTGQGQKIRLFLTGRQHTGENLADVLKRRAAGLSPSIHMRDAMPRNVPKLAGGAEILLANCLAHGRRQLVEVAGGFSEECRYVRGTLGKVYGRDAEARERGLTPTEWLRFAWFQEDGEHSQFL